MQQQRHSKTVKEQRASLNPLSLTQLQIPYLLWRKSTSKGRKILEKMQQLLWVIPRWRVSSLYTQRRGRKVWQPKVIRLDFQRSLNLAVVYLDVILHMQMLVYSFLEHSPLCVQLIKSNICTSKWWCSKIACTDIWTFLNGGDALKCSPTIVSSSKETRV